ncbi:MAG: hypothetical protein MUC73_13370 [Cyclobacteriaceae bacterium]|jgi:hypothetical protein|nr:hypothetical protein [Cyclobacteriaceae bacterium]
MKQGIVIGMLILTVSGWAQSSKLAPYDSIQNKDRSEIRIGLRYTSDYFFMGRNDSAPAPYLSPSLAYYHKSGLFLRGNLSYLTAEGQQRVDLISFTGGYDYYGTRLALGASVTEYIFSDESYVVQAEMSTYINTYAGYDFNLFMLFADASLGISDGTDLFLTFDISRMFFTLHNRLTILPSLAMNMGTQRYYDQYYQYRSPESGFDNRGNGKGNGGQQPPTQPTTEVFITESDQFQILDYEASLQLTYKLNPVRIFTIGTWTFPVNPATVVVDGVTETETLNNGFFWTVGVRLTLGGSK